MHLTDSTFIETEIVFRNFAPSQLLPTLGFPAVYFDLLTNENKGNNATQTCNQSIH